MEGSGGLAASLAGPSTMTYGTGAGQNTTHYYGGTINRKKKKKKTSSKKSTGSK